LVVRLRKGFRQVDVANLAHLSPSAISRHEHGRFTSVRRLRRHAAALDLRLDFRLVGRGGELDRLADDEHAAIVETLVGFMRRAGYETDLEVTFSEWGERGRIDVLASDRDSGTLAIAEVKGELTHLEAMLGSVDIKVRLAPVVARRRGWPVRRTKLILVVAATSRNRQIVAAHSSSFARFEQHPLSHRWLDPLGPDCLLLWVTPQRAGRERWVAGRRRARMPSSE
jgi:transcriptional regulator with XRE-family HTH domain